MLQSASMTNAASIRIGALTYHVRRCSDVDFERLLLDRGADAATVQNIKSFVSYDEQLIVVRERFSAEKQRELIIHELVHAAIEDSGHVQDDRTEALVSAIAPRLSALLQELPELLPKLSIQGS